MPRMPNIYLEAQYQQRLWTPAVLRPAMWLDAADISTISVSTGVSEWRDKSGFGQNATQATGANQPSISAQSFNGLDTLLFDGSNDRLAFDGTFLVSTSFFMALVFARRSTGACFVMGKTGGAGPTTNSQFACGYTSNTNLQYGQFGNDLNATVAGYGGTPVLDIVVCRKIASVGGGAIIRLNGSTVASNSNIDGLSAYPNARICEQDYFGTLFFNLNLAEIISCTNARSGAGNVEGTSAIQRLEGYLSWKWAIPLAADHPFANRPPLIGD